MGDPFSIAAVGGVVLTEAVKFLFDQASSLLKVARERRRTAAEGPPPADTVDVPVPADNPLDGQVSPTVDATALDGVAAQLSALTGALWPYANGDVDIEQGDPELLRSLDKLRGLLETVYGQRLTLRGESREATGTRIEVRQSLGAVGGAVVGVEADDVQDATISVDQSAASVDSGGSVVGVRLGSIGAPGRTDDTTPHSPA